MSKVGLAWAEYLQQYYAIDQQAFLTLLDDVRDAIFFGYLWLGPPHATECDSYAHLYIEHFSPYATLLYRCCVYCASTEALLSQWEPHSFSHLFELVQISCWDTLSQQYWLEEDAYYLNQVKKILQQKT